MLRDNFWLDGIDAASKGIVLQKEIEFEAAEPVLETIKVPGRDGSILYYDGSYKDVRGTAKCYVLSPDAALSITEVNSWLLSSTGYRRLQTMHEPQFYRLARITKGARLEPRLNLLAPFDIELICKPYKFYLSGEEAVTFSSSGSLLGPTDFPSLPLITVSGSSSGTVTINGSTLTLTDSNGITLDCETKDAYKGTTNKNSTVSGTYPTLGRDNTIAFTGGVTSVAITPRWRTI